MSKNKKGLVIVNTGNGKGKSTAAFGVILRAWGRGMRACVIQFIKAETGKWGEVKAAQKLGIEWLSTGNGFTWLSRDMDETTARAQHGWKMAQEKIARPPDRARGTHRKLLVLPRIRHHAQRPKPPAFSHRVRHARRAPAVRSCAPEPRTIARTLLSRPT